MILIFILFPPFIIISFLIFYFYSYFSCLIWLDLVRFIYGPGVSVLLLEV